MEHTDGPTLVLAGAGSGKTRVLTHKIAYLVSTGIQPWRILAVTFTNKAAREMVSRVENLLGIPAKGLWIGTFHSICVRILRMESDRWHFHRDFTIYDRDDQLSIVRKILKEHGVERENANPAKILGVISGAKNDFVSPEELQSMVSGPDAELYVKVYTRYMEILRNSSAFDFDDLLVKPVEMFQKDTEALERWRERFDHILVDEYQDTNRTQYLLMKLLSKKPGNITVVGDDDQSIYSWRGANIQNILGFERDFPNAEIIKLEENYRSNGNILKAANAVVANNKARMPKQLWTKRTEGDPVQVIESCSDKDEALKISEILQDEMRGNGWNWNDFAILYRTNAQSRSFEEVFRRKNIKYNIVGGVNFYDRKEIKDIIAYLRLVVNPGDAVSFERSVSSPRRGIGDKTLEALQKFAASEKLNINEVLSRADEALSGSPLKKTQDFYNVISTLLEMRSENGLALIGQTLVQMIDYNNWLEKEFPENYEERIDNVNELITAMGEFVNETEEDDLSAFLGEVSLMTDVDNWEEDKGRVTLMTLHAAKGLEFPSVFVAGVEKGLFPLSRAFESENDLEEERRLFYVGLTRAEEKVHVSYCQLRHRYGSPFSGGASMFIEEIPKEITNFTLPDSCGQWYRRTPAPRSPVRQTIEYEDYSQEVVERPGPFRVGSFVRHPSFGRGKIVGASGKGDDMILTIRFGKGEKKIAAKYGKLIPA